MGNSSLLGEFPYWQPNFGHWFALQHHRALWHCLLPLSSTAGGAAQIIEERATQDVEFDSCVTASCINS